MADLFVLGLIAHLVADWFLQNAWQANNKSNLRHPAAWVHWCLHNACMLVAWWYTNPHATVASLWGALIVPVTHLLIDTRKPLVWWRKLIGQTVVDPEQDPGSFHNQAATHVAFWQDQAAHIIVLGIASAIIARI